MSGCVIYFPRQISHARRIMQMPQNVSWIRPPAARFPDFGKTLHSCFDESHVAHPRMAVFRRVFELKEGPENLIALFSGDTKFRLYVNGRFVDDGPVEVGGDYAKADAPDWWFISRRDLAPFLRRGRNTVVAELINVPEAQTDYSVGHSGFMFELRRNGEILLQTDSTWRVALNLAYGGPRLWETELFPEDYLAPEYDDSAWDFAESVPAELAADWKLKELNLPPLEEETIRPDAVQIPFEEQTRRISNPDALCGGGGFMEIQPGPPVVFLLRFPEEAVGHLEFEVEAEKGAELQFDFQEHRGFTHERMCYRTGGGRRTFRLTRLNVMRYVKISVSCSGFASPGYSPLRLHSVVLHRRFFPLPETSPFRCSDLELERVRGCIDRTMRLCMMRLHLDSPVHQEGLGCTGDYMIESLISCALYGETRLAAADILRTAYLLRQSGGFMFHTSYSLLYTRMVLDYLMYSGDFRIPREVFPQIDSVLSRFTEFIGPSGLVSEAPNYLFIDWAADEKFNYHHPPASRGMGCMTAFYVLALNDGAKLAKLLDLPEKAAEYRSRAGTLAAAFRRELWDPEKRCFRDGIPHLTSVAPSLWLPSDDDSVAYSVHTNALAVASGIVPESEAPALLERILTDESLLQPQPYFMHFVFDALRMCGEFGRYGFALLKRWDAVVAEHPESLKECWNCGDYCHAWGGTPAYQIARSVFGVELLEPGAAVRIVPEFGALTFAEGEVPTVRGAIRFLWENGKLKIRVPENIRCELNSKYETEVF